MPRTKLPQEEEKSLVKNSLSEWVSAKCQCGHIHAEVLLWAKYNLHINQELQGGLSWC